MQKPFAITLDVGSSPGQQDRLAGATERPVYVAPAAAVQRRLPGRREHPGSGSTTPRRGDYERAWRTLVADNPLPAVMGRVCYHPCETACNRAQLDEAVGINAVERFLGDEAIRRGWKLEVTAAAERQARARRRRRARPGLSAAYHLALLGHDGDDPRRRARWPAA